MLMAIAAASCGRSTGEGLPAGNPSLFCGRRIKKLRRQEISEGLSFHLARLKYCTAR
jgi:hypothetical protein